ncbi:MAG: hypothetical protein ACTSQD_09605, partial [Promethearchaeota archaeon]
MPKDLKNVLDKIEANEGVTSRLDEKVEKLTLLAKKQKKIIADQTGLLEKQKQQISKMVDIPDDIRELRELIGTQRDDIRELRELIGTQRGQINEREIELGQTKGLLIQAQKELELTTNRMGPMQIKLDASLDTMGKLKEEIVQKNSEILIRNETLKTFQNKITELGAFSKALQERLEEHKGGVPKKEVEDLKIQQSEERQKLKTEISKLDSKLLNQKLEFQEKITEAKDMKENYDDLVKKLEENNKKYVEAHDKNKSLEASMEDLRNFKKENINKISYLDMLQPLMEEDPLFKGFFIVQQVGS